MNYIFVIFDADFQISPFFRFWKRSAKINSSEINKSSGKVRYLRKTITRFQVFSFLVRWLEKKILPPRADRSVHRSIHRCVCFVLFYIEKSKLVVIIQTEIPGCYTVLRNNRLYFNRTYIQNIEAYLSFIRNPSVILDMVLGRSYIKSIEFLIGESHTIRLHLELSK